MPVDAALTAALAWARWRGRMLDVTSRGCLLSERLLALAAAKPGLIAAVVPYTSVIYSDLQAAMRPI